MEEKVAFHLLHHIPYIMEITGSRIIFKSERGDYMSRSEDFLAKELSFIKSVKHHIIKQKIFDVIPNHFKEDMDKEKIKYYAYSPRYKAGDFINGGTEIDMKSAYWETANMANMLTAEIYKKGIEVSKLARLASIGTLAKKSRTIIYDGKTETDLGLTRSEMTEFLWDTICYKVGEIMSEAAERNANEFIFFWVDGIFVTGNEGKKTAEFFKSVGYKASVSHCEWFRFETNKVVVKSKEKGKWKTKNGKTWWTDERPFPFNNFMAQKEIDKMTD